MGALNTPPLHARLTTLSFQRTSCLYRRYSRWHQRDCPFPVLGYQSTWSGSFPFFTAPPDVATFPGRDPFHTTSLGGRDHGRSGDWAATGGAVILFFLLNACVHFRCAKFAKIRGNIVSCYVACLFSYFVSDCFPRDALEMCIHFAAHALFGLQDVPKNRGLK